MAGNCVVGWLPANRKQQIGALSIEAVVDVVENDCWTRCRCCGQIGMAVDGEKARRDDELLRDDLSDGEQFELMLWPSPPLRPVFTHRLSILS